MTLASSICYNADILVPNTKTAGGFVSAKKYTFKDYMAYLQDSVANLSQARTQTGRHSARLETLSQELQDKDPFVSYRATKRAIRLLRDKSLYH